MPLPLLLAAALPSLFQFGSGLLQGSQAGKVRPDLALPPGQAEELAARRQAANSQVMPGQTQVEASIRQGASQALNNATQAGNSSSNILATGAAINQNQNNAFNALSVNAANYQQQQKEKLNQALLRKAQLENERRQEANVAKSALTEGSARNIFGGLSGISSTLIGGGAFGSRLQPQATSQQPPLPYGATTPLPENNDGNPTAPRFLNYFQNQLQLPGGYGSDPDNFGYYGQ